MVKQTRPSGARTALLPQAIVLSLGALVFAFVFFADKTLLTNQLQAEMSGAPQAEPAQGLAPLGPDPTTDSLFAALRQAKNSEEKTRIFQSVVLTLQARKRPDHASLFADSLVKVNRSFAHLVQAGKLAYEASQLDYVAGDSSLSRQYARTAVGWLEIARNQDSLHEETLLYLGLAYIASGVPENSMKGILTIREVLQINPDNPEAGYQLGVFSNTTGQFDKAEQRLLRVLQIDPDHQRARLALADAYAGQSKWGAANEALRRVISSAKDPDLVEAARQRLNRLPSVSP